MNAAAGAGVRRVTGLESEYGISVPGDPAANPMLASGLVVQAYGDIVAPASGLRAARWDYAGESPLHDARGWTLRRSEADPSMLTDEAPQDPRAASCVTPNGARLYVDHAHPEYSSPECLTPREAITWDRAGEVIAASSAAAVPAARLAEVSRAGEQIVLYKNNTDGKGASYGTHENYLVARETPFGRLVSGLIPFFVTRQVITGAGRVGIGQRSQRPGFQISSRADFMEALAGLETTFLRPLVNTRDEPHATPERYRRLHVICGDANLCDVAGLLKVGMTSLVLGLIEAGRVPAGLELGDPLAEVRLVSRDLDLTHRLRLADGRRLRAVEILEQYRQAAAGHVEDVFGAGGPDAATAEVMRLWEQVLGTLSGDPLAAAAQLDWAAKLRLLQRYRERDRLGWEHPRLAAIDIQWSDLRPGKGIARALEAAGQIERLTDPGEVARAVLTPPPSTRAWLRGTVVAGFAGVRAASWQSVAFDLPGEPRLALTDPLQGSAGQAGGVVRECAPDAAALLARLGAGPGEPGPAAG